MSKIKPKNSTLFITNQSLLSDIRNKHTKSNGSFKILSTLMKKQNNNSQKKVQLIKKKSYNHNQSKHMQSTILHQEHKNYVSYDGKSCRTLPNQQNIISPHNNHNGEVYVMFMKLIRDIDGLQQIEGIRNSSKNAQKVNKCKIRVHRIMEKMQSSIAKTNIIKQQKDKHASQNMLLYKIETLYRQKNALKRETQYLKEQIKKLQYQIEQKITKSTKSTDEVIHTLQLKEGEQKTLQQIVLSQSQLINKQCMEQKTQKQEFRALLKTQAKELQFLLRESKDNTRTRRRQNDKPYKIMQL